PRISNNIKKIILDQHSMERILPAIVFSQSTLQPDALLPYLTGDTKLRYLLTNQITHLHIDILDQVTTELNNENESNIFT
ncbi:unnamed protein product, partial [Rotaria sordida]